MINIKEEQTKGSEFRLIADYDNKYAGELVYELFSFDAKTAYISTLEILVDFQEKGIATKLLEKAIDNIFTRSYMHRILIQDGSDKAITSKIAQKLGFEIVNNEYPFWLELQRFNGL